MNLIRRLLLGGSAAVAMLAGLRVEAGAGLGRLDWGHEIHIQCFGPDGTLKWQERIPNLVVDTGLDDILDKYYKGSGYTAAHYVGLKNAGSIAAGDTMASHAGWTENTGYSNATRPALTMGTVASQSVDNAAAKAVFNINATGTITGAFVTTNSTKGGTTGTLVGAAEFAASRGVASGDTLNVTITASASSS